MNKKIDENRYFYPKKIIKGEDYEEKTRFAFGHVAFCGNHFWFQLGGSHGDY